MERRDLPLVWLPGAGGQVGQALLRLFPEPETFVWHPTTRSELDLSDLERVSAFLTEHRFDAVVNCAAFTDVNGAETKPKEAETLNADLPALIFGTIPAGIHLSTNYVFPSRLGRPYEETERPLPSDGLGVYGFTKLIGERKALSLGATVLRTAWVYGPRAWGGTSFYSKIRKQIDAGKDLSVVTDEIGNPTTSLTLARVIYGLLQDHFSGKAPLSKGLYHVTDAGVASRFALAQEIVNALGTETALPEAKMADFPSPVSRPSESVLAPGRLSERFSLKDWKKALREVIEIDNQAETI